MTARKLLVVMLFLLVLLPFVSADTTTNPYPQFTINYDDKNAPITIVQAILSDSFAIV